MRNVPAILLVLALAACAFYAGRCTAPPPQASIVRDTVPGDSIPYPVYVGVPSPREIVYDTLTRWQHVDTATLLAAYFARCYYSDTLKNDTSAFIALAETVSQNRIIERSLLFQNRRPTAITTTVLSPAAERKLQLYGHFLLGKEFAAPVVQMGWDRWQFSAGYNLQQSGVVVGVGYRIR